MIVEADREQEPSRKGGGKCTGGRKIGNKKQDSQGGRQG